MHSASHIICTVHHVSLALSSPPFDLNVRSVLLKLRCSWPLTTRMEKPSRTCRDTHHRRLSFCSRHLLFCPPFRPRHLLFRPCFVRNISCFVLFSSTLFFVFFVLFSFAKQYSSTHITRQDIGQWRRQHECSRHQRLQVMTRLTRSPPWPSAPMQH